MLARGTKAGDAKWREPFLRMMDFWLLPLCAKHAIYPGDVVRHIRAYHYSIKYPLTEFTMRTHGENYKPSDEWCATTWVNQYGTGLLSHFHVFSLRIFRAFEGDVEFKQRGVSDGGTRVYDLNNFPPSMLIEASPHVWSKITWRQGTLF
jgi:hypothetical protein